MRVIVTSLENGVFPPDEEEYLINRVVMVPDSADEDGHYLVRFLGRVSFLIDSEFVALSEYCADAESPTPEEKSIIEMIYPKIIWED